MKSTLQISGLQQTCKPEKTIAALNFTDKRYPKNTIENNNSNSQYCCQHQHDTYHSKYTRANSKPSLSTHKNIQKPLDKSDTVCAPSGGARYPENHQHHTSRKSPASM
jgi:hypothetical protein